MSADLAFDAPFRLALDASPCPMVLTDAAGTIRLVNRAAELLFDYRAEELAGGAVEMLLPVATQAAHKVYREQFRTEPLRRPMGEKRDLTAVKRDGSVLQVEVGLNPIETPEGSFVLAAVVDLTERKRLEEEAAERSRRLRISNVELAKLAATDALTDLWNRRAFLDQMEVQMEQAVRRRQALSLLILDLDQFKAYNDEFGHLAGDEVLVRAAALLKEHARRADYPARIGGEEFAVLMTDADRDAAMLAAERIRAAVDAAEFPRRKVTLSVGAATVRFDDGQRPPDDWHSRLLAAADRALYFAKEHGRNRAVHVEEVG